MKKLINFGNQIGFFFILLFVLCFAWFWLHPVHQELHKQLLELAFYGYKGMDLTSFIFGVIQSYVWGYVGVAIWCLSSCCTKNRNG